MDQPRKVPFGQTLLVRDTCVCLHTQRAARALGRRFDEALQPVGLTNGQFSLLMSLNRPEPPAMGSVAQLLAMDRTTLTASLKVLERRGLVRVLPDEKDRRTRRLSLTDEGADVLAAAMPIWRETHGAVEAALGGEGAEVFRSSLRAVTIAEPPLPSAGEGGPRSGSGGGSALSVYGSPLSRPSLTQGPPSPAEGGG